ncbi:DUF342 domain-containing protein [Gracilibacillus timonensis]|uniref:DUF342 domain-containing protein n=1 Tax=Gracilibacillus timonensis TaxID=1816696 RepID=UPI000824403A|nr:FapA family protein [Gracilibacillus timonensis]
MINRQEKLIIKVAKDRLSAKISLQDKNSDDNLLPEDIYGLIKQAGIKYGIIDLEQLDWKSQLISEGQLLIAQGKPPIDGENGKLIMKHTTSSVMLESERSNFRDVKKIPMVEENEVLAQLEPATNGEEGIDVYHKAIKQKRGKPYFCKAGNGVVFVEQDQAFRSTSVGQLSVRKNSLHVYPRYQVDGDLSLKIGNIDFNGAVTITGNVPAGYQVKAKGDITIYGMVEASEITSGGNILIYNGIAGMEKAVITAEGSVEVSYINQAKITAGGDLRVKRDILHSFCTAGGSIFCTSGSIIGGECIAGKSMEVATLGNPANTKTNIVIRSDGRSHDFVTALKKEETELNANLRKVRQLGDMLQQKKKVDGDLPAKERIMLLKQRNTMNKIADQLLDVETELAMIESERSEPVERKLIVTKEAFENVELAFDKYKRILQQRNRHFQAYLKQKEIVIHAIEGKTQRNKS